MDNEYISIVSKLRRPYLQINFMKTYPQFHMNAHYHEFYHINFITKGNVVIRTENQEYSIDSNSIFVLPPSIPHELYSQYGYEQIGIDLAVCDGDENISQEIANWVNGFTYKKIFSVENAQEYSEHMKKLLQEPTLINSIRIVNLVEDLILKFLDSLKESDKNSFRENFLHMISTCKPWSLTLSDMCTYLALSRTQLEKQSKLTFGCGAVEYCARLRFAKICNYLCSDETLESISQSLGFYDVAHMSRFFHKRAHMSLGEFRKKYYD